MCGIVAHVVKGERGHIAESAFDAMLKTLERRGPDDSSVFRRDGITLGHRRLSIIDVAGGGQPVFNETGSVACILNGEIYNFRELRARLESNGHRFTTQSDTEVIVHLYEEIGELAFAELTGMFAIVLADFANARILVARDRMGEKPLYYVDNPDFFTCASELKAFRFHPAVEQRIDRGALASYLRFGWIAGTSSIIENIRRLEPAHYLVVDAKAVRKHCYWRPELAILKDVSRAEICEMLRTELHRTIQNKLIADVPLGVFLSGGLDSSTVVAMAAQHSRSRLKTFSVGFGSQINELPYARMVSQRYDTDHTEIIVEADIVDAVRKVALYYDEPFADCSSVPTYLISKAAREHVTVILTGDGGDELLAGYEGYARLRSYSGNRWLSKGVTLADAATCRLTGWSIADALYPLTDSAGAYERWIDSRTTFRRGEVAGLLGMSAAELGDPTRPAYLSLGQNDPVSSAFEFDLNYYLPDDLLKKVDMAAMANSLETRAPLLDHRLVELCMRIPVLEKVRGGRDKSLLREAMQPYLPPEILKREKQGFGAPLASWLSGELKESVADLLSDDALVSDVIDRDVMRAHVRASMAHLESDWRAPFRVWTLIMLEQWLRCYKQSTC